MDEDALVAAAVAASASCIRTLDFASWAALLVIPSDGLCPLVFGMPADSAPGYDLDTDICEEHESRLEVLDPMTTDLDAVKREPDLLLLAPGRSTTTILAHHSMPRRIVDATQYVGDVPCRYEFVAD